MKPYKYLLTIFLASLLWSSCKETTKNIVFQIQQIDNIICSNVSANARQVPYKIDISKESYFVYINPLSDSIGIHKIKNDINTTISIPSRNFIKEEKHFPHFYLYSYDSIFWFNPELFEIYIFNSLGEVSRRISTASIFLPNQQPKKFFVFSKKLYYSWFPSVDISTSKQRALITNEILPVCELDIKANNDSLQFSTFGNFPDAYLEGKYYYNLSPLISCGNHNQLILSYENDHKIYIYQNSTLLGEKKCKSNFINSFNEIPDNKFMDIGFSRAYQGREARYTDFIYDPFRDQYYRITKLKMENHASIQTAKWTIIIMDASFNVVGEVVLPYLHYMPDFIVPTSEGIYIQKTPANEKELKGELILSLVKFIK